jgi:hypothetical protein
MKSPVRVTARVEGGGWGMECGCVEGEIFKTTPEGAVRNKTILPLILFVLLLPFSLSLLIDFLARLSRITDLTTFGFALNSVCWLIHVLHMIQLPCTFKPPVHP